MLHMEAGCDPGVLPVGRRTRRGDIHRDLRRRRPGIDQILDRCAACAAGTDKPGRGRARRVDVQLVHDHIHPGRRAPGARHHVAHRIFSLHGPGPGGAGLGAVRSRTIVSTSVITPKPAVTKPFTAPAILSGLRSSISAAAVSWMVLAIGSRIVATDGSPLSDACPGTDVTPG